MEGSRAGRRRKGVRKGGSTNRGVGWELEVGRDRRLSGTLRVQVCLEDKAEEEAARDDLGQANKPAQVLGWIWKYLYP
jgi:hypothetical protein